MFTGTGFGVNDAAPTADVMLTVTVGPDGDGGVDGDEGEDDPPPHPHRTRAPTTANAAPDTNEDRMLNFLQRYEGC
jgi:hypothetical protein